MSQRNAICSRIVGLVTVFSAVCLSLPVLSVESDTYNRNWPQWRGPAGNGLVLHGNPPLEWSETDHVKWKVRIPGKGHASPVIWEDRIFLMTAVSGESKAQESSAEQSEAVAQAAGTPPDSGNPSQGVQRSQSDRGQGEGRRGRRGRGFGGTPPTEEYAFTVMCLDRKTGKVLWEKVARKEVPHQGIQGSNTYSSGSPVTDGERLYVSFGSYGLYCYDLDGNLLWEKDLGKVSVTFGEASSPALVGDVLVVVRDCNDDSYVYGFDKKTGRELWKTSREERSGWTTPYILEHDGKTQVVINGSTAVRGYDPKTGDVLWQCSGLGANAVPVIVSDKDTVYAMSGHRNPAAMAIALGGSGDLTDKGAIKWKITRGTPYVPSPVLYDGLLFFCQRTSATFTCLDAGTGEPFYEQERLEGISGVYASPIGVQDRIYLAGQNGTTVVVEKSKELKILASNTLEDGFDASPSVVGNELFLRGREHLYCISEE